MRILVVEDEKILGENLKLGLKDEGFAVDLVENGRQAYEIASSEEYDVIVLDRMLPELDGLEVCQKLREEKIKTPILMLTARSTTEDKIDGLNSGADDYLTKPFVFDELLARIRSLIRRSTTTETILKVDSLCLDPQSHKVTRVEKEIKLTGKEYSLLEYFMHHPNEILTREQIINHVWDYNFDPTSNIIEVLIRRLRNKIDKNFPQEKQLWSTIRGLGYKLGDN